MPITLGPISRRAFLAGSTAAGLALLADRGSVAADVPVDPDRFAFLSDVHINADATLRDHGVVMYDHLKQACDGVLAMESRPAAVFINGDCAHHKGRVSDYETFLKLVEPLRDAGLPLHLTMGNHDVRENLWKTIPQAEAHVEPLPDKQVMVIEHPRANIFLLDSLEVNDKGPGELGEKQIHWLAGALDSRTEKPAIVMVHHHPGDGLLEFNGLRDAKAFLEVILPRKQVKALFYGHTHVWEHVERSGVHCVNLPAVAYIFTPGQPMGWVDAHLRDDGMTLKLRCLNQADTRDGQTLALSWRK